VEESDLREVLVMRLERAGADDRRVVANTILYYLIDTTLGAINIVLQF